MNKYYRYFIKNTLGNIKDIWTSGINEKEAHKELLEKMNRYDIYGMIIGFNIYTIDTVELINEK